MRERKFDALGTPLRSDIWENAGELRFGFAKERGFFGVLGEKWDWDVGIK